MILYLVVITVSVLLIILSNIFFGIGLQFGSLQVVVITILSTFLIIAVDGLCAFIAHSLPKKLVNPNKKFFKILKNERRFYERLGIKKWKDLIPDLGFLVNFSKSKIAEPKSIEYIDKYIQECVYGEIGHTVSCVMGFSIILFFNFSFALYVGLPISIVNFILNLLPIFTLRYNRSKLVIIQKRLIATSNR